MQTPRPTGHHQRVHGSIKTLIRTVLRANPLILYGRGGGIRTRYPLHPMQYEVTPASI